MNRPIVHICDLPARNQLHVSKHKMAENYILSKNVKKCDFVLFSSKQHFWARLYHNICFPHLWLLESCFK